LSSNNSYGSWNKSEQTRICKFNPTRVEDYVIMFLKASASFCLESIAMLHETNREGNLGTKMVELFQHWEQQSNFMNIHFTKSIELYTRAFKNRLKSVICVHTYFVYSNSIHIIPLRDFQRCNLWFSLWVNMISDQHWVVRGMKKYNKPTSFIVWIYVT